MQARRISLGKPHYDDVVLGLAQSPYPHPQMRLSASQQAYHGLIWGSTVTGKSRLLQSVFLQHLDKGNGVGLIEPHSDLSLGILKYLAARGYFDRPDAFDKLIYIDFSAEWGVPFNILAGDADPHTTALNVMDAFVRAWPDLESAPLFRTLFPSACLVLIANRLPITALVRLLQDAEFRAACLARVDDPMVREMFAHYEALGRGGQATQAASTIRRVFILTFSPIARLCLGQAHNALNFRRLMDEGTSLIVNLGTISDADTRGLMGANFLVQLEQAALSRSDVPEDRRRPWTLLLDEWPQFSSNGDTLENILAQTRKFKLRLYLAAQYLSQVDSKTLAGALENCRLSVTFRLGRESAQIQARHIADLDPYRVKTSRSGREQYMSLGEQRESWAQTISNLPDRSAFVKLSDKAPVRIETLTVAPPPIGDDLLDQVVAEYRRRYQVPAAAIGSDAFPSLQTQVVFDTLEQTFYEPHSAEHPEFVGLYRDERS